MGLPKVIPMLSPLLHDTSPKKFCANTPTSPDVIGANMPNFRPNLKFSQFFFGGGGPSPLGCAVASLGQSLALVKICEGSTPKGPKCSLTKKCIWVVNISPYNYFVCGPKFTGFFVHGSTPIIFLSNFGYLDLFWRYSRSKSEDVWNCTKFCMFLAPNFLVRAPDLWTCIIKFSQFPIVWQSFTAIGWGTSEIMGKI